ncbi:MAG: undecaprenyl-phosphate galactose phosphotransferase WbaP, partial [Alphaproteobacteria bacterium]|nr:undecaprenyl-phosphate galactose phosphotransferase WbaP [Alphaproteobacteria bacterium]
SDCVALFVSFIVGGLTAWALNTFVLGETFQQLISLDTLKQMGMFASLGVAAILWLDSKGHYRQRLPFWEIVGNIVTAAFIGFIMGGFVQFAAKTLYSRLWLGFSWAYFAVFIFAGRIMMRRFLDKRGEWKIPSLIIGNGATAEAAIKALAREKRMGFNVTRQMSSDAFAQFNSPRAWERMMMVTGIGHIFLALEGGELDQHKEVLKGLVRERVPYSVIPPWLGLPSSTLSPHHFMMQDVMMLHNTNQLSLPLPRILKRSFDIVVAGTALILLSPLFLIVGMIVKSDGGPAFFAQSRVGRNGKMFKCLKFRSMKVGAEAALKEYLEKNPEAQKEWNIFYKLKNDPRVTKLGEFIRKTSIDELPQLINVVIGDMSLVGPRPIKKDEILFYEGDYSYYESVRPGISGAWQVSGRSTLNYKQRVALDAWYSRNWSLWLDIVILLKTIPALLAKDQAY